MMRGGYNNGGYNNNYNNNYGSNQQQQQPQGNRNFRQTQLSQHNGYNSRSVNSCFDGYQQQGPSNQAGMASSSSSGGEGGFQGSQKVTTSGWIWGGQHVFRTFEGIVADDQLCEHGCGTTFRQLSECKSSKAAPHNGTSNNRSMLEAWLRGKERMNLKYASCIPSTHMWAKRYDEAIDPNLPCICCDVKYGELFFCPKFNSDKQKKETSNSFVLTQAQ